MNLESLNAVESAIDRDALVRLDRIRIKLAKRTLSSQDAQAQINEAMRDRDNARGDMLRAFLKS